MKLEDVLSNLSDRAKSLNLPPSSVQIASMIANTPVSLLKGGREYIGRVSLRHKINGVIGTFWNRLVNNWLAKHNINNQMVNHPRSWGKRIPGQPLVEHTTKDGEYRLYLEFFPLRSLQSEYLVNRRTATQKEIEEFSPFLVDKSKKSSITLDSGERISIDRRVRDYRLDHIEQIFLLGEICTVENDGSLTIHQKDGKNDIYLDI